MDYNLTEIRARIASLRVLKGKSVEEVSNIIGVTKEQYIAFENGAAELPLKSVVRLTNELGYKLSITVPEEEV